MQVCAHPQGETSTPKKGLLSQLQQTGGIQSEAPQMQLSGSWALGPMGVLAAFSGIFTPQMLEDQEQQHLPSCQRQQVLQTL